VKVVNGRLVLPNEYGIGLALDSQDENLI